MSRYQFYDYQRKDSLLEIVRRNGRYSCLLDQKPILLKPQFGNSSPKAENVDFSEVVHALTLLPDEVYYGTLTVRTEDVPDAEKDAIESLVERLSEEITFRIDCENKLHNSEVSDVEDDSIQE